LFEIDSFMPAAALNVEGSDHDDEPVNAYASSTDAPSKHRQALMTSLMSFNDQAPPRRLPQHGQSDWSPRFYVSHW
jgi:hypothetical protein